MRVRTHPGEILRHEFLDPLEMSATALAQKIDVPANRITDIIRGRRDVTADTALRLAEFFDTTPEFWMNLQTAHDLSKARFERGNVRTGASLERSAGNLRGGGASSTSVAAATTRGLREPKKASKSDMALAASALPRKSSEMKSIAKPAKGWRKA